MGLTTIIDSTVNSNEGITLRCPIRGYLKVTGRGVDGLTPTEERFRVEAINYLLQKGYPRENFLIEPVIRRFGNSGRNSTRADFAVLDVPAAQKESDAWVLEHAVVLAEIKRDSVEIGSTIDFQVKPLLDASPHIDCIALYWDNVQQIVLWREQSGTRLVLHEGPIEILPDFGHSIHAKRLGLADLRRDAPLKDIFKRIEDTLHASSISPNRRFQIMMQILLAKIYDEQASANQANRTLKIQDFRSLGVDAWLGKQDVRALLTSAVGMYQAHLPSRVTTEFAVPDEAFLEICKTIAPYAILSANHRMVQDFYMYFAKGLYRWDLAQHFTPPPVTDFIVNLVSPNWDETVLDPACGSADFLTSAFRRGREHGFTNYADRLFGYDLSEEAVQVAVLNMVLNGDGKSNIKLVDSLRIPQSEQNRWDCIICNPPFGARIVERDPRVLANFDMGCHGFTRNPTSGQPSPLRSQEAGILFIELCIRLLKPDTGRMAIVVPNGYLGNISAKFVALRRWILQHTQIAAIVALPRFTFKSSGADVSASILVLKKRLVALQSPNDGHPYPIAPHILDNVGWNTGDTKGAPQFARDESDGTLLLDDFARPVVVADFDAVLTDLSSSDVAMEFPWLAADAGQSGVSHAPGYTISSRMITSDDYLTMDPKKLSRKNQEIRKGISLIDHFRIGDVADIVPELRNQEGARVGPKADASYSYVEIQDVNSGHFTSTTLKGWQLPSRARHFAEPGDIYVGSIWGSVTKWFLVGERHSNIVVTNGMYRLRLHETKQSYLLDLLSAFCTEEYAAQMRASARGSDGLAEVRADDLMEILIPVITDDEARASISKLVEQLTLGVTSLSDAVSDLTRDGKIANLSVPKRKSHVELV